MNKFLGIFFLVFFFFSCSSDLDFDQIKDLKLEPVVVANLARFDVAANQFVTDGVEQDVSGNLMNFDIFKDEYFKESLNKIDLFFEINNTIDRRYVITLYFLDKDMKTLYTIPFAVPAYTGTQNLVTKTEVFEGSKLNLLKKSEKIAFVVNMLPGPPLNEDSTGSLKLRSSSTLYFGFE